MCTGPGTYKTLVDVNYDDNDPDDDDGDIWM